MFHLLLEQFEAAAIQLDRYYLFFSRSLRHYALQRILALEPDPSRNINYGKIKDDERNKDPCSG
jgi:hypothetical protein